MRPAGQILGILSRKQDNLDGLGKSEFLLQQQKSHLEMGDICLIVREKVYYRWFAYFNRRDKEGMLSLLSSDCHFESLALQETFAGPQVCA